MACVTADAGVTLGTYNQQGGTSLGTLALTAEELVT
jgi:hypothetical protein